VLQVELTNGFKIPLGGSSKGLRNLIRHTGLTYTSAPKLDILSRDFVVNTPKELLIFIGDEQQSIELRLNNHVITRIKQSFTPMNTLLKKTGKEKVITRYLEKRLLETFGYSQCDLVEAYAGKQKFVFLMLDKDRADIRVVVEPAYEMMYISSAEIVDTAGIILKPGG
jgi:hypothetical protein